MINDLNKDNNSSSLIIATPEEIKSIVIAALEAYLPKPLFCGEKEEGEEELFTREETAELLGVNASTLWRWTKDGTLPCVHVGRSVRYKRSTIRKYMNLHEGN